MRKNSIEFFHTPCKWSFIFNQLLLLYIFSDIKRYSHNYDNTLYYKLEVRLDSQELH